MQELGLFIRRVVRLTIPQKLVAVHTTLILASMFALWNGWFLTPLPYDCVYIPFLIFSGPIVYFVAHFLQHASEVFLNPSQVMIAWNLVPGTVCLILGGTQWYFIGCWLSSVSRRRNKMNRLRDSLIAP
jgi:hypothetical protein